MQFKFSEDIPAGIYGYVLVLANEKSENRQLWTMTIWFIVGLKLL